MLTCASVRCRRSLARPGALSARQLSRAPRAWTWGAELTEQVAGLLVVPSAASGLSASSRSGRTDLARAAAWAVQALTAAREEPLAFFVC